MGKQVEVNAPDMGEVIRNILQAEARAEEIRERGRAESKRLIARAEAEAAAIEARAEEDVTARLRQLKTDAELDAGKASLTAKEECEGEKRRLEELAKENSTEAVKIILGKLSEKYDR
ncbi:MAG TPA: hypothetical protein IAB07_05940 [Candidatus Caccalectryoclostridium excrementigallinarum]|uniref:ATPase n=1 Tax=Candidatus Caccalectryoclostridium excrementigallinarum TaxID=2840710 RepID=A0A9D1SJZ4_9FIRM|nr:hypothetical protein [Candidatus Caccalectryoclostridium excrementigallinarum]